MKFFAQYDFLTSPTMLFVPSCVYVALAILGGRLMAKRAGPVSPEILKPVMQVYNVVQIVVCSYMTLGMLDVVGWPNVFGINSPYTEAGEWFVFCHYLSKWLDWCDTLFIILKKNSAKQLSFLHVYHHATIGVVWGYLLSVGHGNGTARYGAFINSVTHVLMYTHYLVTSVGLKNPLKRWLTTWQITQFWSCFAHAICILFIWPTWDQNLDRNLAWLQFGYHITMIYLFTFKMSWVPAFFIGGQAPAKASVKKE
jgi:elongation of very long chain fatty acids protein 4